MGNRTGINGISADEINQIVNLHSSGKSHAEIVKITNRSLSTVIKYLKLANVYTDEKTIYTYPSNELSKESIDSIIHAVKSANGKNLTNISEELGISRSTVKKYAILSGVDSLAHVRRNRVFDEIKDDLYKSLKSSSSIKEAAEKMGISSTLIYSWTRRGKISEDIISKLRTNRSKLVSNKLSLHINNSSINVACSEVSGKIKTTRYPEGKIRLTLEVDASDAPSIVYIENGVEQVFKENEIYDISINVGKGGSN